MIKKFTVKENLDSDIVSAILGQWANDDNKVFHLKNISPQKNIRDFYENIGNTIGKYELLAEDVTLGDRSNQMANKIWMDVRYDSNIKDAYRHSANPQPLHTDGSYIPNYPNATLMCCISNTASGGETTFLELKKLVEALKEEDPKLLEFLQSENILHERSGYINKKKILYEEKGILKINFNYYCVSKHNSQKNLDLIKKFFDYTNTSEKLKKFVYPVKLDVGEAVFWKDSEILHGRNGFVPQKNSDRFLWKAAINISS